MRTTELSSDVLCRQAVVYVRQSTASQVHENLESQRRQYDLVEIAKRKGFSEVEVIDDDLGKSASGTVERPGFDKLVAMLCAGKVGAVFCLEASRLARNGRDWHQLLELCGLVGARVIDADGVYDPCRPNDRLVLGMKGTISEYELGIIRSRMTEALWTKAARGELRIPVPIGFFWGYGGPVRLDPDKRIQEVINTVFQKFQELGSARQVLLWMVDEELHFPRPKDGKRSTKFEWYIIRYRNIISLLKNPFYAGAYAYGKSENQTHLVGGRLRKSYGHQLPMSQWRVLIKDHHEGYIKWEQFERNQDQLARNNYSKKGGAAKSGRGGRALLSGMLRCRRCGHVLGVVYSGRYATPKYRCGRFRDFYGDREWCIMFSARVVESVVVEEIIRAVQPLGVEASVEAERQLTEKRDDARRLRELELEQARYEAHLAERRYAACDPDNRLVAGQLEAGWEECMQRVARLESIQREEKTDESVSEVDLRGLAEDLQAAWNAQETTMKTRQRLVRTLIEEIIVDVDDEVREIEIIIHWKGGRHSQVRVRKPKTGEHTRRASEETIDVIRSMAGRWSDEHIAANLNRMGLKTGQGKTWNERRVQAVRHTHGIRAYKSAGEDDAWLTMSESAEQLGVTNHVIRKLIKDGVLPAEQVVPRAPYQIRSGDLALKAVVDALEARRKSRPCRKKPDHRTLRIPGT